jgi:hypothetical protein
VNQWLNQTISRVFFAAVPGYSTVGLINVQYINLHSTNPTIYQCVSLSQNHMHPNTPTLLFYSV